MTEVFVAKHPTEAHLVAGFLNAQGIPTEVRGEALFGVRGDVPPSPATLPTVWVDDACAAEARQALASAAGDPALAAAAHGTFWRCAHCGETVEPQFAACWQCGSPPLAGQL